MKNNRERKNEVKVSEGKRLSKINMLYALTVANNGRNFNI